MIAHGAIPQLKLSPVTVARTTSVTEAEQTSVHRQQSLPTAPCLQPLAILPGGLKSELLFPLKAFGEHAGGGGGAAHSIARVGLEFLAVFLFQLLER